MCVNIGVFHSGMNGSTISLRVSEAVGVSGSKDFGRMRKWLA